MDWEGKNFTIICIFAFLVLAGCSESREVKETDFSNAKEVDVSTGLYYHSGKPEGLSVVAWIKDESGNTMPFENQIVKLEVRIRNLQGESVYIEERQVSSALELMEGIKIPYDEIDEQNPMSKKHLTSVKIILPDGGIIEGVETESSQPVI